MKFPKTKKKKKAGTLSIQSDLADLQYFLILKVRIFSLLY